MSSAHVEIVEAREAVGGAVVRATRELVVGRGGSMCQFVSPAMTRLYHLAQVNVAIPREPVDSALLADFVAALDPSR